jgi:hypothetical protein
MTKACFLEFALLESILSHDHGVYMLHSFTTFAFYFFGFGYFFRPSVRGERLDW